MKKGAKYILSIYATKKTVREAVKKGCFISAKIPEARDLEDAKAVEFDIPIWEDEENLPEETRIGFRTHKTSSNLPISRKKTSKR